jgi:hypothetical protein
MCRERIAFGRATARSRFPAEEAEEAEDMPIGFKALILPTVKRSSVFRRFMQCRVVRRNPYRVGPEAVCIAAGTCLRDER